MVRRVEGESPVDLLRHSAPQPLICCLPLGPPPSRFTANSTMDSSGMLRGLLLVGLLSVLCHGQASREVSAEDFGEEKQEAAVDRDLLEALDVLLGRNHNQVSSPEKRGSIPLCNYRLIKAAAQLQLAERGKLESCKKLSILLSPHTK
uniref:Cocaine- and amphetamine-regulated transcript-like n=1 Tax=Oreochromis niloticus TaxID=8128 RepID=A0A669DCA0_ORENI